VGVNEAFALLDALPVAIYTTDADGRITYYNDAAAELWGHRPELGSAQWCGSWRLYWSDGRPMRHDECPMAQTLKEGRPVLGVEAIAERPDGTRVNFAPHPTPLRDSTGKLTGAINLLTDITERRQSEIESAKLAAIVVSSDDAIVSKTLDGRITSWNAGASRIFGYEAEEIIGQLVTQLIPPELYGEETQILAKLANGERVDHYETVRLAKDGRRIEVSLSVSPVRDGRGIVVGASKVARDITERKQSEKLQRLLTEELSHRVKNTLATVQSIASQSLDRAKSQEDFISSFSGRIQAIARAHTLLSQNSFERAGVEEIIRDQVLLGGDDDNRISLTGPALTLDQQSAVHLSLILHELATNARKYGALSAPSGRLSISWTMRTQNGLHLTLDWHESGGPRVIAPVRSGFGTTLIQQTLQIHGGKVGIQYEAQGLSCEVSLPLPEDSGLSAAKQLVSRRPRAWTPILEPPTKKDTLKGKRIIIIEDEPIIAMDMAACLTEVGCEIVGTAGSLEMAKQLVEDVDCDAALLDSNLSGEHVGDLAALLTRRKIPFAFASGYGREGLPQGFRDALLLSKPFAPEQVRAVVETLLYRSPHVIPIRQKT